MQIRHLASISTSINPFSPLSKTPRLFLSLLPPAIRSSGVTVTTTVLPRGSPAPNALVVRFRDGKEMRFEFAERKKIIKEGGREGDREGEREEEMLKIGDVVAEVQRHCRVLGRKEALGG